MDRIYETIIGSRFLLDMILVLAWLEQVWSETMFIQTFIDLHMMSHLVIKVLWYYFSCIDESHLKQEWPIIAVTPE